jgi:hypothetical protein
VVTRSDDSLELEGERVGRLGPAPSGPDDALVPAVGLADVVGQVRVLVNDVGVEQGHIGIAPLRRINECSNVMEGLLQERSKTLHVLLRHRARSISRRTLTAGLRLRSAAAERPFPRGDGRKPPLQVSGDNRSAQGRLDRIRGARTHLFAGCVLVALVVIGCDERSAEEARRDARFEALAVVLRYCSYGAVSQAQAESCDDHVDVREVLLRSARSHPSNAALYGVGRITACRADAGAGCTSGETLEETKATLEGLATSPTP